jgi:hypothetical protein
MQGSNKRKEHREKKNAFQRRTRATQEEYEEKRHMAMKICTNMKKY